ncbi:hypothetical protein QL285_090959 [Trifolium repens]|nr:hypothetical protein QL285_090959 [Trifolium repens]
MKLFLVILLLLLISAAEDQSSLFVSLSIREERPPSTREERHVYFHLNINDFEVAYPLGAVAATVGLVVTIVGIWYKRCCRGGGAGGAQ